MFEWWQAILLTLCGGGLCFGGVMLGMLIVSVVATAGPSPARTDTLPPELPVQE